jgi:ankyrin repeat protein
MVKKSNKPIPNCTRAIEVCRDGDLESLKVLIEDKGVNINTKDKDPESRERLIDIAVRKEYVEIIEYLIEHGVDINDKGEFRHSLLDYACSENLLCSAEVLCANDAKIESRTDIKNPTIFRAVRSGDLHLIKVIIGEGGKVTQRNKYNETVFHIIFKPNENIKTSEQRSKIFKALIKEITENHHLTLNQRDKYGLTPLHLGCKHRLGLINIPELIRYGADVTLQDNLGKTALHYLGARKEDNIFQIAELLIQYGALVNLNDKEGRTPLSYACEVGNEQLITLLLSNKAEINLLDKKGKSSFYYACKNGNLDLIRRIFKEGVVQGYSNRQAFIDSFTSSIKRTKDFNNNEVEPLLRKLAADIDINVRFPLSPKQNSTITNNTDKNKEPKPFALSDKQNKSSNKLEINPKALPNIIEGPVDQDREDIRATLRKARAEMKVEKLKKNESKHQPKFDSKKEATLRKRQALEEKKRIKQEQKEKLKADLNSSNVENVVSEKNEKKYYSFNEAHEKIKPLLMILEEKAKPYEGYFTFVVSVAKNNDLSKCFADTWQEIVDNIKSLSPEDFLKLPESTKRILQATPTPATYFNIAKLGISLDISDKKLDEVEIEGDSEDLPLIEELAGDELEDPQNEEEVKILETWKMWESKLIWTNRINQVKRKMNPNAKEFVPGECMEI